MYIKCENDSWEHIMDSLRSDEKKTPLSAQFEKIHDKWCSKCRYEGYKYVCDQCHISLKKDTSFSYVTDLVPSEYSYDLSHLDKLPTLYEKYCREFPDHLTVGDFGLPSICPDELCECDAEPCPKDNPEDCNECMDCWAKFGYDSPYRHVDSKTIFKSSLEDFHSYFIKKLLFSGYSVEEIEKQYIKDVLYLLKRKVISEDKAIRLITSMKEEK